MPTTHIAVIGSGIAGLSCAHALAREHAVTLYEAAPRLGGHTHTVDVRVDGVTHPVDTGFLVFNQRTYPNLIRLFAELQVPMVPSDMSFSVSLPLANGRQLEWAGTSIDTVFAQRRNALSPKFLGMLRDLLRFNAHATRIALGQLSETGQSLGEFLERHRYTPQLRDWYLLPMAGAIWSCSPATMLDYPVATFIRFCHNHGLLQIGGRPQWFTVPGGARQYVDALAMHLPDVRVGEPVLAISRNHAVGKVLVRSRHAVAHYDQVVVATHSDQALRLLADADDDERRLLAAVAYQPNRAVLHTDTQLLPRQRKLWSSWNYASSSARTDDAALSVTYLLSRLQPLPFSRPLMVSLNPFIEPAADTVIGEFEYAHPVFDAAAIDAQRELPHIQGRNRVWFAGAWTGYGFHEDGLRSGLAVAAALRSGHADALPLAA